MAETFAGLVSEQLPRLAELLGSRGLQARDEELERLGLVPLWQVERDLELLTRRLPWTQIARAYRDLLRNRSQFVAAMYEIRVAAMLAPAADRLEPPPGAGEGRCDLKCGVGGKDVFIEVTARADKFPPSNAYDWGGVDQAPVYGRVTVEESFAATSAGNDPSVRGIPASKELRDRISQEAAQLPSGELTVLVMGAPGGRSADMECALWGDEIFRGRSSGLSRGRVPNGVFGVADDVGGKSRLSAVVWMKLVPHFHDVRVHSRLFTNPLATRPLPPEIEEVFRRVFDRRAILEQELERIKGTLLEKYAPEQIILFGSMADASADKVHEWSDIDLAIVKSTRLRFVDRVGEVMDLLEPRVGLNVLVYTPEEFERAAGAGHFFVRDEIIKKGRVLFP